MSDLEKSKRTSSSCPVLSVWFCSRGGRCLGRHPTLWADIPPPRQTTHPLGRHPPLGKHSPLGRHPSPADTPPPEGHCSGRNASYWNAFLFHFYFWWKLAKNSLTSSCVGVFLVHDLILQENITGNGEFMFYSHPYRTSCQVVSGFVQPFPHSDIMEP